jgi:LacI family transcriptional regulator
MADNGRANSADVTIRDVARVAGVSVGTVSRVLNNHPSVRAPMREAVLRAIKKLDYEPNETARLLRSSRTHTIAILVSDIVHSMNGYAVHGAEDAAEARGYSVIVAETRGKPEREIALVHSTIGRRAEGLLCQPERSRAAIAEAARSAGIPVVFFGQVTPRSGLISAIVEEADATASAVHDLIGHGHRHIALISAPRTLTKRRIAVIRRLVRESHGDAVHVSEIAGPVESLHTLTAARLAGDDRPTAVIVLTHQWTPAVLLGLRTAGLDVPRDISLIAYGDSDWAAAHTPAISVITGNYQQHVAEATDRLIDMIEGEGDCDAPLIHRSEYVRRESVGRPPA